MPDFAGYPDGSPSWVDLATSDLPSAVTFYTALFGWDSFQVPGDEYGGYTFFLQNGKKVAAVAPVQGPRQPPAWNMSISVSDIDKTVRQVEEAGAKVHVPPMQVVTEGKFAMFMDPSGAATFLWQPQDMIGADVANEINTWVFNILRTRDGDAATKFYADVFGWEVAPMFADYSEFRLNGERVAGLMTDSSATPTPSFWSTVFRVADCAESTKRAVALGGTALAANQAMDTMTFSVIADPQGAGFQIVQMAP